jgi:hypothetical protein
MPSNIPEKESDFFCSRMWAGLIHPGKNVVEFRLEYKGSLLRAVFVELKLWTGKVLLTPSYTPYNLIVLHGAETTGEYAAFEKEVHLLQELRQKTRDYKYVQVKFHKNLLHAPAASLKNSRFMFACSAWIPGNKKLEHLRLSIFRNARNHLHHAEAEGISIRTGNLDEIGTLLGQDPYYSKTGMDLNKLQNILSEFSQDDSVAFVSAVKEPANFAAGVFIRSGNSWYLLINLINKHHKSRSANTALIWQGICHALENNCDFHFDGSLQTGIMQRFKSFDAETFSYCYGGWYSSRFLKKLHSLWI